MNTLLKLYELKERRMLLNQTVAKASKKQEKLNELLNKQAAAYKKYDLKTVRKLEDKIEKLSKEIKSIWNKVRA